MNNIIFLRLESKYLEYGYMSNFTCLCQPDYYYCLKGSIKCTGSLTANNQFLPFSLSELITLVSCFTLCWRDSLSDWSALSRLDLRTFISRPLSGGLPTRLCFCPSAEESQVRLGGPGDEMLVFSWPVYMKRTLLFFVILLKAVLLKKSTLLPQRCLDEIF